MSVCIITNKIYKKSTHTHSMHMTRPSPKCVCKNNIHISMHSNVLAGKTYQTKIIVNFQLVQRMQKIYLQQTHLLHLHICTKLQSCIHISLSYRICIPRPAIMGQTLNGCTRSQSYENRYFKQLYPRYIVSRLFILHLY